MSDPVKFFDPYVELAASPDPLPRALLDLAVRLDGTSGDLLGTCHRLAAAAGAGYRVAVSSRGFFELRKADGSHVCCLLWYRPAGA